MAVGEAVKEGGEVVFVGKWIPLVTMGFSWPVVDMQNNTNVDALVDALEGELAQNLAGNEFDLFSLD